MHRALLALAAGLASLRFLPELPPQWLSIALITTGLLLLPQRRLRLLALLGAGLGWACYCGQQAVDGWLEQSRAGQTFWVEGRISGLPEQQGTVWRFELDQLESRHAGLPERVRLAWYGGPGLRTGEHWRLAVRLKPPRGLVNPAGLDYAGWLLARGIGATGTVKAGEQVAGATGAGRWRDRLRRQLLAIEASRRQGILAALVTGDVSGLSRQDWQVLQDTGTVHLLVISGQHISLLAGLVFWCVWALFRRGWWPACLPWLPAACLAALGAALLYGGLAGFGVPVLRACVMLALLLLWRWRFFHLGLWLPWLGALDLVLLLDPLAGLLPGFWLSFGAVAVLVLALGGRLGRGSGGRVLLQAQWGLAIGLLPLLVGLGLPVSLSAPLANLVAVPWVSVLLVPLSLLGALLLPLGTPGILLLKLAGWLANLLFALLHGVSQWQAAWQPPLLGPLEWLLLACGCLLLLAPAGLPVRLPGLLLCLPLLFPASQAPAEGRARVVVLDVGQGLAVLVRTRQHALLYDSGPRQGDFDLGERVVRPSLQALGVRQLDLLLLSHADSDHMGGAEAVLRGLPVRQLVSGESDQPPAGWSAEPCHSGQGWQWDQVRFQLWQHPRPADSNQASCILLVEASGEQLLLMGDADQSTEDALLATGWPLAPRWLMLGHHGSRTASSSRFLQALGPGEALVSRGWLNPFNHPHPEVLQRLRGAGRRLHDTAEQGALLLELGSPGEIQAARTGGPFWNRVVPGHRQ